MLLQVEYLICQEGVVLVWRHSRNNCARAVTPVTVRMPICCVAGGCSNTYKDGVSSFNFPKDQPRWICWINKVLTTRANWTASEHSMLCSRHFGEDCFEPEVAIASSFGINRRKKLKPTAVPSLFKKQPSTFESAAGQTSRKRMAQTDDAADVIESTTKKPRTAYEKRERSRVSDHDCIGFIVCF